jgi:2'-5' RNA ligase/GNAT superfamily N-acetyltransferase
VPRARVGVVLPIPADAAREIDGLRRALDHATLDLVGPHVTLVAPVNVRVSDLDEAMDTVREAAARTPPLRLRLGPPATFWPATPVVYLAVDGDLDALDRVRAAVSIGPLARPPAWPFVPHVSLADDAAPDVIPGALTALASYRVSVTVTSLQLLEERPDRSWQPLADVTLSGRRVVGRGGLELVIDVGAALDQPAARWLAAAQLAAAPAAGARPPPGRPLALAARREGSVVGAAVAATDEELWLEAIAVDPAVRRQGVGRHLLRAVEAIGVERSCRRAWIVCPADGPGPAWLASQGWVDDLELPAWRRGRPFVRMHRDL